MVNFQTKLGAGSLAYVKPKGKGENGDCLTSCMRTTWFYAVNRYNMKVIVRYFVEVFKRRGLKVNADKRKAIALTRSWEATRACLGV